MVCAVFSCAVLLFDGWCAMSIVQKRTALMIAAKYGHTETVKALLSKGADVHGQNSRVGMVWSVLPALHGRVCLLIVCLVRVWCRV